MPQQLVILAACVLAACGRAALPDKPVPATVADNTAFACDLYGQLKARDGNLFLGRIMDPSK